MSNASNWLTLFTLQAAANDTLAGPNWRNDPKTFDYKAALSDEVVEARLAAGYAPFWSGGEKPTFDANNLKLEIVDILHFLMSDVMQATSDAAHPLPLLANNAVNGFRYAKSEDGWDAHIAHDFLGSVMTGNIQAAFEDFARLCGAAGMSFPELYGKYIAKNALNVFRKSIGYKQDKSVKYWVNDGDRKIEDNVFVMAKIDAMIQDGEDLLALTYDGTVDVIRTEYTRVTGKVPA